MAERPIAQPLPADLPENWTAGQIVSPGGTDVGLTEKHGYNYLMEMVNRAQTAVNEINTAFETISSGTARLVVGTSTNGWTAADCDYLCDGTDDQVEIQQALNALSYKGGEVILLAGNYYLSGYIFVNQKTWLHGISAESVEIIRNTADGYGEKNSIICLLQSSRLSDFTFIGFASVSGETYDIAASGTSCHIQNIIFPLTVKKSIYIEPTNTFSTITVRISNCYWALCETAIYVKAQHGNLFVENNIFLNIGGIFLQTEKTISGGSGLGVYIKGNGSQQFGGKMILDGLSNVGGNIIEGNVCNSLTILNTFGRSPVNAGNIIAGNIFWGGSDGGTVVLKLGEKTSGWFVTGNVLFETDETQGYLIQDLGTNNIVRFNSDDTGGSTPATVQQATPVITVSPDGQIIASATQQAGYVAAGTKSATVQLSSAQDPDFTPENIKDGVSVFGVTGTMASGGGVAGVSSFNGRDGEVVPSDNDYTAAMVGAIPNSPVSATEVLTEAEYNALTQKDATTLYLVKE